MEEVAKDIVACLEEEESKETYFYCNCKGIKKGAIEMELSEREF